MNLRNYGSKANHLLRVAPWADLKVIREKLAERLLAICEQDYFSDRQKAQVIAFSEGEEHTVVSSVRTRAAVNAVLAELYPTERIYDTHYGDACSEFWSYFFYSDDDLGIHP